VAAAGGGGGSGSVVEQDMAADVDDAPAGKRTWQQRVTRRRRWSLNAM